MRVVVYFRSGIFRFPVLGEKKDQGWFRAIGAAIRPENIDDPALGRDGFGDELADGGGDLRGRLAVLAALFVERGLEKLEPSQLARGKPERRRLPFKPTRLVPARCSWCEGFWWRDSMPGKLPHISICPVDVMSPAAPMAMSFGARWWPWMGTSRIGSAAAKYSRSLRLWRSLRKRA